MGCEDGRWEEGAWMGTGLGPRSARRVLAAPRARGALAAAPRARAHARTARASPPQPAAIRSRHRAGEVGAWGGDRSIERLPASLWMWTGLGPRVLPSRWMPTGLGPRSFSISKCLHRGMLHRGDATCLFLQSGGLQKKCAK